MKKITWIFLFLFFTTTLVFSQASIADFGSSFGSSSVSSGISGIMSFIPFIVILIIIVLIFGSNRSGPVLVLKEFKLNENDSEFLKIVGRASGFLSWIMSLFGFDPITSLSCNKQAIKFEKFAIRYGKITINIPLVAVTGVSSGINKPFGLLILGIIFILGGIIAAIPTKSIAYLILGLILGVIFLVFYSLKKNMVFSIYNGGDKPIATIRMKRSIIEGQSIDEHKYEVAANELNKAVLKIHFIIANFKNQNSST